MKDLSKKSKITFWVLILLMPGMVLAQKEVTKTISKEWTLSSDATVEVKHYRVPVKIKKANSYKGEM